MKSYLEIGVDNPDQVFNHIDAEKKVGVDPYELDGDTGCHLWNKENRDEMIANIDPEAEFHRKTSDEYFEDLAKSKKFDIIFIDGLHLAEQVEKDFFNAYRHLKKRNGIIIIDDVCPNNHHEAKVPPTPGQGWRGSVWEFWAKMRGEDQNQIWTVALELGLGVVDFAAKEGTPKFQDKKWPEYKLSLQFYFMYRKRLMNERPLSEVKSLLKI